MKRKKKEIPTIQEPRYSTTENSYLNEYADHDELDVELDGKEAGDQFRDLYWDEYADDDRGYRTPVARQEQKRKRNHPE